MTEPPPLLSPAWALFLDFDGTLAPIAPRPEDVRLPGWVLPTLERTRGALGGALVVVSGRPLAQLDHFLSPLKLPAAGVHGVERRLADGRIRRHSAEPPPAVDDALRSFAGVHAGLRVERKPGAIALHYRQRPELEALCVQAVETAIAPFGDWQVLGGKCVVEVKQQRVSKGSAVRAFLAEPAFAARRPVFVGDDATDEDGIAVAQQAGGIGIKVGGGDSAARHRLADVAAVGRWLAASFDAA